MAILRALEQHSGQLDGTDYRPASVVASYTYAPQTGFGVVMKEDRGFVDRRFGRVIREVILGLGLFLFFGGVTLAALVWVIFRVLVGLWTDPKQQDDAGILKANGTKGMFIALTIVWLVVLDGCLLVFGIGWPHKKDLEDQDEQMLNNLELVNGMLTVLADKAGNQVELMSVCTQFTNYLNYQVLWLLVNVPEYEIDSHKSPSFQVRNSIVAAGFPRKNSRPCLISSVVSRNSGRPSSPLPSLNPSFPSSNQTYEQANLLILLTPILIAILCVHVHRMYCMYACRLTILKDVRFPLLLLFCS